jgi:ABC-type amino acid transport substrate-binding protein
MRNFAFFLILFTCFNLNAFNENRGVIKAAVAEEFIDGLHSKYLKYFAEKLNLELELSTMPFARRLLQIKSGQLDLIVGIQRAEERQDEFIYILPHYESLSYRVFSLKENHRQIKNYQDFAGKYIGINRYAKYFTTFDADKTINKFKATGVLQNIELLLHNRIDAFMHYEESTLPLLEKIGERNKIVKTIYQPNIETRHYLAISSHSSLNARKSELEKIVQAAISNKDLLTIRLNHYADTHKQTAALAQ